MRLLDLLPNPLWRLLNFDLAGCFVADEMQPDDLLQAWMADDMEVLGELVELTARRDPADFWIQAGEAA